MNVGCVDGLRGRVATKQTFLLGDHRGCQSSIVIGIRKVLHLRCPSALQEVMEHILFREASEHDALVDREQSLRAAQPPEQIALWDLQDVRCRNRSSS